jgi:hypothetical protein
MEQLQQGFATNGTGFRVKLHGNNFEPPNVRFGSKADIARCQADVRFTPKSGHSRA